MSPDAESATPNRDAQFCARCGVSTDLHGGIGDEIEEWECDVARSKADLLDGFYGMFAR